MHVPTTLDIGMGWDLQHDDGMGWASESEAWVPKWRRRRVALLAIDWRYDPDPHRVRGFARRGASVSTWRRCRRRWPAARGSCSEKHTSKLSTGPSKKIGISNLAGYFEGSADSGATVIGANAAGGQLGPGSASEEVCPKLAGTKTIASKVVGTCIRRLVIKTSVSLARSLGSSVLAYRNVCQKGAGRAGV